MAKRLISVAFLLVIASIVLFARVRAQDGGNQTGRSRRSWVKALRPTRDSDVMLDEFLLLHDDLGHSRVSMGSPAQKGVMERLFWVVDGKSNQYQTLRLTNNDAADAARIRSAYRKFGRDAEDGALIELLSANRTLQKGRVQEMLDNARGESRQATLDGVPSPGLATRMFNVAARFAPALASMLSRGGTSASLRTPWARTRPGNSKNVACPNPRQDGAQIEKVVWSESCQGYGYSDIQVWEPAAWVSDVRHLNETFVSTTWNLYYRDTGETHLFYTSFNPWCWANGNTFFNTSWSTLFCQGYPQNWDSGFDASTVGQYRNSDFLNELSKFLFNTPLPVPVPVYASAVPWVRYANGSRSWGSDLIFDGSTLGQWEAYVLLSGVRSGQADDFNCYWFCDPSAEETAQCNYWGYTWDQNCICDTPISPIVLDLDGNGFELTDVTNGVVFDMFANGVPVQTSWTRGGSQDALLVLDRNHNGLIDNGAELFGNVTPQPGPTNHSPKKKQPNGFLALAVFDDRTNGGNGDGMISEEDAIYSSLRLWIDANHDGISQPEELFSLADRGVRAISLRYTLSKQTDQFGNVYRYRSHFFSDSDLTATKRGVVHLAIDVLFKATRL